MNTLEPARVIFSGEPGYRKPPAYGTVDVFTGNRRLIYTDAQADTRGRHWFRAAVARYVLGEKGKSGDLVRLDPIPPARPGMAQAVPPARCYRIGELRRPGSQIDYPRRLGAEPAHAAAGLTLVDVLAVDDPRRQVPGWGKRRGCFLAVDVLTGTAYLYRAPGSSRLEVRGQLAHAFGFNDGPAVEFRGRWPAYAVIARTWEPWEKSALVSRRTKAGQRASKWTARRPAREAADLARRAEIEADRAARARVKAAAVVVESRWGIARRAAVAAVVCPDGRQAEKAGPAAVALERAWDDYRAAVALAKPATARTKRPLAYPRDPSAVKRHKVPQIVTSPETRMDTGFQADGDD